MSGYQGNGKLVGGRRILAGAAVVLLALVVVGCATTRAMRKRAQPSGFLGDYSELRKGQKGEAQLLYFNPETDFSQYTGVLVESVTLWEDPATSKISADDRQVLTDYFYTALRREIGKSFTIVEAPALEVLTLRAAITQAKGAKVVVNTVTSVVPQLRLLTTLGGMATDVAVFVGEAGFEVEVSDSVTHERVAAGVDLRAGTKALRSGILTWSDAKTAFDYWADKIHKRLVRLRDQDTI